MTRTIDDIESNSMVRDWEMVNYGDHFDVMPESFNLWKGDKDLTAFEKMYAKKKALEEYSRHKKTCESYLQHRVDGKIVGCQCTCGLDELLK